MSYRGGELRVRGSAQYPYSSLFGLAGGARGRPRRGGARVRANPWVAHVKRYAAAHRVPYGVAMHEARASYRG